MSSRRHLPRLVLGSALVVALGLWGVFAMTEAEVPSPVPTGSRAVERGPAADLEASEALDGRVVGGDTRPAPATDGPPLRGQLFQTETGAPLPWYHLEFRTHRHGRVVRTDAEGRFDLPFPAGLVWVSFHDHPFERHEGASISFLDLEERVQLQHGAGDGPVRLEVSTGPTFDLDLPRPEGLGVDQLRAQLVWRRESFSGSPIWFEPILAPLRDDGGGTWVRFPAPNEGSRNGPWGVSVHSPDNRWGSGEVLTERVQGRYPQVLRLELRPLGWLTVHAHHDGQPETWPVFPIVTPVGASIYAPDSVAFQQRGGPHTLPDGWLFSQLEEGEYEVTFQSDLHEPYVGRVEVGAHANVEHVAELVRLEIAGDISGTVSSRRGAVNPARAVYLMPEDEHVAAREASIDWKTVDGRQVGHFTFTNVPVGRYRVRPSVRTYHAWSPSSVLVEPPAKDLAFERLDDGDHGPVGFLVVDESGAPITSPDLRVSIRRQSDPPEAARWDEVKSGEPYHLQFPLDAPVEWILQLTGYEPVLGHTEDFSLPRTTSFGECRFAEVVLRRK